MIETVELPELVAIGLIVEGTWQELPRVVPAAWTRLYEADTGAGSFLEISLSLENGVYRELLGFLAARKTEVPDGMTRVVVPAGRYLKSLHDGPLVEIAQGFAALENHARVAGLRATNLKLDFGYLPGQSAGRHELYVGLEPETLRLT